MNNSYDFIAERWHADRRPQQYIDRVLGYVDRVLADLTRGSLVLDLGCGTGTPIGKHIVEEGFRLLGVDRSEKMLAIARREVPEGEFVCADMVEVEFMNEFGGIVAWDSAFHVARKHHAALYEKFSRSLMKGGRLLLSVGGSAAEELTSEMHGHTFSYSGFEPDVARNLLEVTGFEIELWEIDDPTSRGHIAVVARKAR